jgi:hypothetical protein
LGKSVLKLKVSKATKVERIAYKISIKKAHISLPGYEQKLSIPSLARMEVYHEQKDLVGCR